MSPELIAILKEGGGWAVAVVAVVMWVRSIDAQSKLFETRLQEQKETSQKRIDDAKEYGKVVNANTNAIERLAALISGQGK